MKRFNKLLMVLCVNFDKEFNAMLAEAYARALKDYSEEDLLRVGDEMLKGRYFPRPWNFIEAIKGPTETPEDLANLRWSQIVGWIGGGEFPDDQIAEGIMGNLGDRFMFRQCTDKSITGYGFTFRAAYRAATAITTAEQAHGLIDSAKMLESINIVGDQMKMGD